MSDTQENTQELIKPVAEPFAKRKPGRPKGSKNKPKAPPVETGAQLKDIIAAPVEESTPTPVEAATPVENPAVTVVKKKRGRSKTELIPEDAPIPKPVQVMLPAAASEVDEGEDEVVVTDE